MLKGEERLPFWYRINGEDEYDGHRVWYSSSHADAARFALWWRSVCFVVTDSRDEATKNELGYTVLYEFPNPPPPEEEMLRIAEVIARVEM